MTGGISGGASAAWVVKNTFVTLVDDVEFVQQRRASVPVSMCLAKERTMAAPSKSTDYPRSGDKAITTLVVSNIPPRYTTEMLLEEWPNEGTYDMLYLPGNNAQTRNAGFAFVNFTSEAAAQQFSIYWKNRYLAHFSEKMRKPLWVSPSQAQGHNSIEMVLGKFLAKGRPGVFQPMIFDLGGEQIALKEALAGMKASAGIKASAMNKRAYVLV
jgi:hypothetical protein